MLLMLKNQQLMNFLAVNVPLTFLLMDNQFLFLQNFCLSVASIVLKFLSVALASNTTSTEDSGYKFALFCGSNFINFEVKVFYFCKYFPPTTFCYNN